ncbi:histidine--tRNA ligase [bacterium]|nr:histidine--tRNA ligase [bacterium]
MKIQAQKGTKDILPEQIENWYLMEDTARKVFGSAGCKEIRTPIFEATELFARGVGDSTDIVNKEMYTFEKADRSLTLRPENTAGVVRAFIENGFSRVTPPVKLWYKGPMFRYERPQAGRQRQFHQVGVEIFGSKEPACDVEAINLAVSYLNELGFNNLKVELNSLGCPECRKVYRDKIREVLKPYVEDLCIDCKLRYEKNPLRILDCKDENCKEILSKPEIASVINSDFICDECREHFDNVQKYLDVLNIKYDVNKMLVRGLDYYTRTVFEVKSDDLGAQNAILGGGRYDGLVEMLGGVPTPAVGWALGMERLFSLMPDAENKKLDYFIVSQNIEETLKLIQKIRKTGKSVDFDYSARKFAKQLEKAGKLANYAIILGEDEIAGNYLTLKNLATGDQTKVTEI